MTMQKFILPILYHCMDESTCVRDRKCPCSAYLPPPLWMTNVLYNILPVLVLQQNYSAVVGRRNQGSNFTALTTAPQHHHHPCKTIQPAGRQVVVLQKRGTATRAQPVNIARCFSGKMVGCRPKPYFDSKNQKRKI